MSNTTFSKTLLDMMTDFTLKHIMEKSLHGVTYAIALKDGSDARMIEQCMKVRQECTACGFNSNEVFRVFEVFNGYIFDADMSIIKKISKLIAEKAMRDGQSVPSSLPEDLIGNVPETNRKEAIHALAKHCKAKFESGERNIDVALFNRNITNKITITGFTADGEKVLVYYPAFRLRQWDLVDVNTTYLAKEGIKINSVNVCEILPSKTGLRVNLGLQRV